jgi:hypothetical protein
MLQLARNKRGVIIGNISQQNTEIIALWYQGSVNHDWNHVNNIQSKKCKKQVPAIIVYFSTRLVDILLWWLGRQVEMVIEWPHPLMFQMRGTGVCQYNDYVTGRATGVGFPAGNDFFLFATPSGLVWVQPSLLPSRHQGISSGYNCHGVKLSTHLEMMSWMRMRRAMPPLTHTSACHGA